MYVHKFPLSPRNKKSKGKPDNIYIIINMYIYIYTCVYVSGNRHACTWRDAIYQGLDEETGKRSRRLGKNEQLILAGV